MCPPFRMPRLLLQPWPERRPFLFLSLNLTFQLLLVEGQLAGVPIRRVGVSMEGSLVKLVGHQNWNRRVWWEHYQGSC